MAEALGMSRPIGIVLDELHRDSPFRAAGLAPGDVVTRLAGAEVNSPQEMMFRLAVTGIGKRIDVAFSRGGKETIAEVELVAPPKRDDRSDVSIAEGGLAGLSVAMIDPALIVGLDLPLSAEGVVITSIEGPLMRAGMIAGDIILGINGEEIKFPEDVLAAAAKGGRGWSIDLLRAGQLLRLRFRL
jgi:S1-C subfamily serine protease